MGATLRQPTRKELRKEQRKQKKARKNEYFSRGKKAKNHQTPKPIKNEVPPKKVEVIPSVPKQSKQSIKKDTVNQIELEREKENKELQQLKKKMTEQRKKQLLLANEEEDRNIKKLAKQLKLNKRKSKGLPKMFVESGLDYILDMCDPEQMKTIAEAEKKFTHIDDEFDEDLALISGKQRPSSKKNTKAVQDLSDEESSDNDEDDEFSNDEMGSMSDEFSNDEMESGSDQFSDDEDELVEKQKKTANKNSLDIRKRKVNESFSEGESDFSMDDNSDDEISSKKRKRSLTAKVKDGKKLKIETELEDADTDDDEISDEDTLIDDEENETDIDEESEIDDEIENEIGVDKKGKELLKETKGRKKMKNTELDDVFDEEMDNEGDEFGEEFDDEEDVDEDKPKIKGAAKINEDGTWEDIYGRLHAKDGSLMTKTDSKYVPPAARAKLNENSSEDKSAVEKLNRLKKQVKGLLNRLAMTNMHNIAKQIENLYMNNSRNDMNETLSSLINESIISQVLTPERLLMEHIYLVAVLHANIGTEVGAHFLQVLVFKFDQCMKNKCEVEDKTLDNVVISLAQMYNFKVFDSKLIYEILNELAKEFTEKNVDCILHILRNVGFVMRKDDPLALKDFILESNKKAAAVTSNAVNGSRLRFLLDVLTAIKNNNMMKIPNYDDSYSEHLKKIMKSFIRKGNYVSQLNITMEDLLKAEEKGKWWVVGSAWTGNLESGETKTKKKTKHKYSEELLEMARKMRMNTDTRRDIFCVIMSAENYNDAFEKLMHLGLTKNQEKDIIHVLLVCCVEERPFNPYYALLAQKFCDFNRRFMLTFKYAIWDKIKTMEEQSAGRLSSLASLLIHLFLNQGLPISILKVIEFAQMDAITTRFLRQIFLGILLHKDVQSCLGVFKNIAQSAQLKMFRQSLRLFLQLFVRKNLKSDKIDEKQREFLKERSKMVEKLLIIKETMNL